MKRIIYILLPIIVLVFWGSLIYILFQAGTDKDKKNKNDRVLDIAVMGNYFTEKDKVRFDKINECLGKEFGIKIRSKIDNTYDIYSYAIDLADKEAKSDKIDVVFSQQNDEIFFSTKQFFSQNEKMYVNFSEYRENELDSDDDTEDAIFYHGFYTGKVAQSMVLGFQKLGKKRIAVIHDENEYIQEEVRILNRLTYDEDDIDVVYTDSMPTDINDFEEFLLQCDKFQADGIALCMAQEQKIEAIRELRKMRPNLQIVTDLDLNGTAEFANSKSELEGVYYVSGYTFEYDGEKSDIVRLIEEWSSDSNRELYRQYYDMVHLLARCYVDINKQKGVANPKKMTVPTSKELASYIKKGDLDERGFCGGIRFYENGETCIPFPELMRIKNGKGERVGFFE